MSQYPIQLYSTISTIAAPFSLFGSSAMLYVISRSRSKFSTTLNRLLVGLCVGDIILSFPMLFSKATLTFEDRESYTAVVPSNQAACSTQGFFITLGMVICPFNNCALCIYYICVIQLNMSVAKIKKNVEPYLHAIPWMYAIIISSVAVATRSINPAAAMCRIAEYRPKGCESDDCARGKSHVKKLFFIGAVWLIITFIAIVVMMTVVFSKVWRQERKMKNAGYRSTNAARSSAGSEANMIAGNRNQAQATSNRLSLRQNVANSRKVLNQALAYAGAYFLTWFFPLCYLLDSLITQYSMPAIMSVIASISSPLQGFFNFFVFIYPRVTQQLRGNDDMNVLQALCAAIRCIPIPPRNSRNRGVGNGAAAGTATGRGGNGAVGTRNISGLLRGGNGATGNTAATAYGSRNISGLRGTADAGNDGAGAANVSRHDSGTPSLAMVSQYTVSTATASSYSVGEVGGGESQIEEEMGQEGKTEIEERITIADKEVGMLDTVAEYNAVEGEQIEGNDDIARDEETGVLKNDTAL